MGMDHHTADNPPTFARMAAAGRMIRSCLVAEMIRLYTPFPKAWNTDPTMMQKPANRKLRQMILSAGIPIASISLDALNIPRSCAGKIMNNARPRSIMITAEIMLIWMTIMMGIAIVMRAFKERILKIPTVLH